MDKAQAIVSFWVDEVGPGGWYNPTDDLDQEIRDRFMADWTHAAKGGYDSWSCCPEKSLALLILLDQFPRNMFRDDLRAFATDRKAVEVATHTVDAGYDMRTPEPERQFYYLPFMHSECLTHQERCVRLMKCRMPKSGAENLLHAKAHRQVIRLYGRFPYRNDALGRDSTDAEQAFMDKGGYGRITRELQAAA